MLLLQAEPRPAPGPDVRDPPRKLVLVAAGGCSVAIPIESVREVVPACLFTPLPGSGSHVCGLINLRGQIVTVIDLAASLRQATNGLGRECTVVIVEVGAKRIGVRVDEVLRMLEVPADTKMESGVMISRSGSQREYDPEPRHVETEVFLLIDPITHFGPYFV